MKVLFLDWDGVLCGQHQQKIDRGDYLLALANIPAINKLMEFCHENDISVVLNSTINAHGIGTANFAMRDVMSGFYFRRLFKGITPYTHRGKGQMIETYIQSQRSVDNVTQYMIIDDEPDKYYICHQEKIIKCSPYEGITMKFVEEVKQRWMRS
ncbi:MAG: HAD domain-containing protein [Anaerotignaceae bacterium]